MNITMLKKLMDLLEVNQVTFIDFETTGLDPAEDYPTEVAVRTMRVDEASWEHLTVSELTVHDYSSLIKVPEHVEISEFIANYTGIDNELLDEEGREIYEVAQELAEYVEDNNTLVVAHSASFELGYLYHHFGIVPSKFLCTKAVTFLEEPAESSSLEPSHKRLCPKTHSKQTHRAMGDVVMLSELFKVLLKQIGVDVMAHYANRLVVEPDRPLRFEPHNAKVLDLSITFDKKPKG